MKYEVVSHLTHDGKAHVPGSIIDFDPEGKFAPHLLEVGVIRPAVVVEVPATVSKPEPEEVTEKDITSEVGSGHALEKKKPSESKKKAQASEAPSEDGKTPTGWCLKCKQMRKMVETHEVVWKNNKRALKGKCQACLTTINKAL